MHLWFLGLSPEVSEFSDDVALIKFAKERELNKFPVFESRVACLTRRENVSISRYVYVFATQSGRMNRLSKPEVI